MSKYFLISRYIHYNNKCIHLYGFPYVDLDKYIALFGIEFYGVDLDVNPKYK